MSNQNNLRTNQLPEKNLKTTSLILITHRPRTFNTLIFLLYKRVTMSGQQGKKGPSSKFQIPKPKSLIFREFRHCENLATIESLEYVLIGNGQICGNPMIKVRQLIMGLLHKTAGLTFVHLTI